MFRFDREHQQRSDLLIYCGHGAGNAFHGASVPSSSLSSSSAPEVASSSKARETEVLPAALLWGCSSGRLLSRGRGHDPSGPALSYLCRGGAFVLGNLWDVTDRDLDRLTLDCMQHLFLDSQPHHTKKVLFQDHVDDVNATEDAARTETTVARCLAEAREVCKMQYAVGAAAVLYGLPMRILTQ